MISPSFLDVLDSMALPKNEYAIYGSGPLGIRNIRDCRDLDVVVTNNLYEKLRKKYREIEPGKITVGDGVDIISGEHSKIKEYEKVIARSEDVNGYKFMTLPDLIEWKKERGREKDLEDLVLIDDYIKNN